MHILRASGLGGSTMVWQHSLWNVDKRITGWDGAFGAHCCPRQRKTALATHRNKVLKQLGAGTQVMQADSSMQLRQQLSGAALRSVTIQTSQHKNKKKEKRKGGPDQVKENPVGCEHPTNWPGEEWKWEQVRGREGGRGEEEKRNSSHTIIHPSQGSWEVAMVTGTHASVSF